MSETRSSTRAFLLFAATLATGIGLGVGFTRPVSPSAAPAVSATDAARRSGGVELATLDSQARRAYVCPMHPNVVRGHPDHCPICGMALVPVEPSSAHGERDVVALTPQLVNKLSVRTEAVRREDIGRSAQIPAYIQNFQPGEVLVVRSPLAGTLADLHTKMGARVHAGDVLFEIDVPGRREAVAEHLRLLTEGDAAKLDASRQRLRDVGFSGDAIVQLEQSRAAAPTFSLIAPQDGQVIALQYRRGDTLRPGVAVLSLQSRGVTSVDVDIFQNQAMWMKSGDSAELRVRQLPGRVWRGMVAMEGLRVNPEKRTYGIRLQFPMDDNPFTTDMYGEVKVNGSTRHKVLSVPHEALIQMEGGNRVIVALGDGRFKPVAVVPGVANNERVEIVSGLHDGDVVVVSSQFLLDSESSMRAEIRRLGADDAATTKPLPH